MMAESEKLMLLDDYIQTLLHYECPQDRQELAQMINLVKGKTSLLEIGSNFGGTLKRLSAVLAPASTVVSVDFPFDDTPKNLHPVESLKKNCERISAKDGHHVYLYMADSHALDTVAAVAKHAPFDFGFIDGDHSYEGVKADWENYGHMCKIVGFHDIAGQVDGCVRFWKELKASVKYRIDEFLSPNTSMGIGIVYRE
jgi:hypothetical protein